MFLRKTFKINVLGSSPTASFYALVAAALVLLVPSSLWAQVGAGGASPFARLDEQANRAFCEARQLVYVMGGMGSLGVGTMAFFGRFSWKWFFSVISAIAILSLTEQFINYAVPGTGAAVLSACS
ncbi:MAG: hypothetical protein AB7G80_06390 [Dongiaceae bacterium]